MKNKFLLILVLILVSGALMTLKSSNFLDSKVTYEKPLITEDTIVTKTDTLSCKGDSTKDKTILYIGDSHTTYAYGWQDQLTKLTGMKSTVLAKGGMRTDWMLKNSRNLFSKQFDYCMIWGGANDAASYTNLDSTISHLQQMVNLCNKNGTKAIVLTGFNPDVVKITQSNKSQWGFYPPKYVKLQEKIMTEIKGALVVKNWYVTRQDGDCGDFICHLSASGHRKMALGLYEEVFK